MKFLKTILLLMVIFIFSVSCAKDNSITDYSGTYCLNIMNMEMTIAQEGNSVTFTMQSHFITGGTGTVSGKTLSLTAYTAEGDLFKGEFVFSESGQEFMGPFQVVGTNGDIILEGTLLGTKGGSIKYDIESGDIPRFIERDFTQLSKIEKISRFRSGFGHSFTDGTEACRSMKHYYDPYEFYRTNNTVEIYSPVSGTIMEILNERYGASINLTNKHIIIRPSDQPAFTIVIFHCDLISSSIQMGRVVKAGELLGYARLYYDDLDTYSTSFDIALWVNTPAGMRLISYFDAMHDTIFAEYTSRGVLSRQEMIITREQRDADPLECIGEEFISEGTIENWIILR